MDLSETIRTAFPGVRDVSLVELPNGACVAVAVVADEGVDRPALADAIVRRGADAGLTVLPAIYDERSWNALRDGLTDAAWTATFADDTGAIAASLGLDAGPGTLAQPAREAILDAVRGQRIGLDAMVESPTVPRHVALWTAARLVRQGLGLLLAGRRLPTAPEAAALAAFDQHFAATPPFTQRHATLAQRLAGLARQAEHAWWRPAEANDRQIPADAELEEAVGFLRALERHLATTLTTDAERAQARRWRRLGILVGAPLLLALAAWRGYATQPEAPITDLSVITKPGTIVGEYFEGENFDRKVFERNDNGIAFSLEGGTPDARLGADHFSIRWDGYIRFDQPGKWHLCGKADDGQRIYFNNRLVVDHWNADGVKTVCETVSVLRGWYPVRVEYFDREGRADMTFMRGPPRRGLQVVPPGNLCCGRATR